jgi:hypothetical protein
MGQKDVDLILGRSISDERFGKDFFGKLGETGNDDEFLNWLANKLKINLSPKELKFFRENWKNLRDELTKIRDDFKIKYEYDGSGDPKRS